MAYIVILQQHYPKVKVLFASTLAVFSVSLHAAWCTSQHASSVLMYSN